MTLLLTVFAALISTVIWYSSENARAMKVSILCYMFWGASLMWFVDAIFEYIELRAAYFTPAPADMINDSFLGFSVIALGLLIWTIILLVTDPKHIIKR